MSTAAPPAAGDLLADRYRLRERIGRGATAEVWAAVDETLRRPVAVKLAPGDPAAAARFRAEAAAAGRITDPAVVAVYDVCDTVWGDALVLELVEGRTLRSELDERGRLPVPEALRRGAAIARALGVVHRAGLVHRDVKPGNVLLVEDRVKLADFGIAEDATAPAVAGADGRPVAGTPKYLAPEQLLGVPVDPRADLYALGALVYEAITGRAPFLEPDEHRTAHARLHRDPASMRETRPDVPVEVDRAVRALLARDPADRPASAAQVADELEGLAARAVPVTAPAVEDDDPTGWWIPLVVLVLVAAASVVLAVLLFLRAREDDGNPVRVVPADEPEGVADDAGDPPSPSTGAVLEVRAIDPFGDGVEHDDELPFLLDGDPATAWSSERYRSAAFGGLKPGLGLVVRVDGQVTGITIETLTPGWSATVHQAPDGDPAIGPGTWGEPIDQLVAVGPTVEVPVAAGGGDVLVWFTALATTDAGNEVRISAIEARS